MILIFLINMEHYFFGSLITFIIALTALVMASYNFHSRQAHLGVKSITQNPLDFRITYSNYGNTPAHVIYEFLSPTKDKISKFTLDDKLIPTSRYIIHPNQDAILNANSELYREYLQNNTIFYLNLILHYKYAYGLRKRCYYVRYKINYNTNSFDVNKECYLKFNGTKFHE